MGGNGERWMAGWEGKGRGRGQMGIGHALDTHHCVTDVKRLGH